ncbi:MAG: prepilin-type N-terminal cleavage/methylation domain-containing protein [Deltaproteobacteria bacterium]|nr:prepilin-type N-terminal cleavage/methylation domain-containing protein [Deltaproteobacteria bacterium]
MQIAQATVIICQHDDRSASIRAGEQNHGMTLVEVIAVLVVIGLAAGGIGLSIGAINKTELKSSCNRLIAAARFAYNRATIYGTTVRVVFDIPSGEFSLQEAHGRVVLARRDDERLSAGEETDEDRGVDVDPWKAAQSRVNESFKPNLGSSSFGPISGLGGKSLSRYSQVSLGRRIKIVRLIVAHEPVPRESGQGAVYFFPGGMTEHAVIHLSKGDDTVYAVEIHPLTGRGKVYNFAYEPPALLGDQEESVSEVDAP